MNGYMCSAPQYKFPHGGREWRFDYSAAGLVPCRDDWVPYERVPLPFWDAFETWAALDEDAREMYRVGGGCERLTTGGDSV